MYMALLPYLVHIHNHKHYALTECEKNQLPFLTLNDTDTSNLSITMSADTSDYENYKYDLVSVDMGDVLYNFYIYPLKHQL